MNILKNENFEKVLIKIILLIGFLLSAYQFFYNRSLHTDEATLALNIINRNYFALLKPLDYTQVAPILFLQIEKIFSEFFPDSEFGLRLFPLLSFWFSILLFFKIIKLIQNNNFTIILSLLIFIFIPRLIYYSSEVKQYMTDLFVLTLMYYLVLRKYKDEKYKYYYLGIAGSISIFLSNIVPIILFTVFVYLLYDYYINNKKYLSLLISISALWVTLFLIYYFSFNYKHPIRFIMITNWTRLNGFMPLNPFSAEFYKFFLEKAFMISTNFFKIYSNKGVIILYGFMVISYIYMFRKKKYDLMIITTLPVLLHLLLSGFKMYPFETRLILYMCPVFIIICSVGFDLIYTLLFSKFKIEIIRIILIFIALLKISFLVSALPMEHQELKKSLEYMNSKIIKGDKLYVHYSANLALKYYQRIHKIDISQLVKNNIFISREDIQKTGIGNYKKHTIDDLKNFKGRYWFLFCYWKNNDKNISNIIKALDSLGFTKIDEYRTVGSSIHLYDFNISWQYSNGPYGAMNITCLETSGANIFAGTKEGGVFLSTDNGVSWTARNNGLTKAYVTSLAISGLKEYAGTAGGGVFLSIDKGTRWTALNNGMTNYADDIIYSLAMYGQNIFAGTGRGIYLSTDNGLNWTVRNNGLNKTKVFAIAINGPNIFAGTGRGVFLSTDNGSNWTAVNYGLKNLNVNSLSISWGNIYAGTDGGIFLSTDNGAAWISKNNGLINLNVHSITINGQNIFAGTEGGVYLSTNNGRRWEALNEGLTDSHINTLAISRTNIFAGTFNSGVWKYNTRFLNEKVKLNINQLLIK
jgi:photosystem II stability/assembly factor-like uncharacterized protein